MKMICNLTNINNQQTIKISNKLNDVNKIIGRNYPLKDISNINEIHVVEDIIIDGTTLNTFND